MCLFFLGQVPFQKEKTLSKTNETEELKFWSVTHSLHYLYSIVDLCFSLDAVPLQSKTWSLKVINRELKKLSGTPLVSSQDSLPTLIDEEGSEKLEEYYLSTEVCSLFTFLHTFLFQESSSVLDRQSFAKQLELPDTVSHIHTGYGTTVVCFDDGRISIE